MTFTAHYPPPDQATATARDVAGWYAAHALYLLGLAERADDDDGRGTTRTLTSLALADAEARTAYLLNAQALGSRPDCAARALLLAVRSGESVQQTTYLIAREGGYDPHKARTRGYES